MIALPPAGRCDKYGTRLPIAAYRIFYPPVFVEFRSHESVHSVRFSRHAKIESYTIVTMRTLSISCWKNI
jgi:hypothetical protein